MFIYFQCDFVTMSMSMSMFNISSQLVPTVLGSEVELNTLNICFFFPEAKS